MKRLSINEKLREMNWSLIMIMTTVACIGFVILYSAADGNLNPWASKQMIRFMVFFPIMLFIAMVDIRVWFKSAYFIYSLVLVALIFTELWGATAMGATRWLRIGALNVQPSELMKLSVVFALAHYFHTVSAANIGRVTYLIIPLIMVLFPVALVMKQPDLGTAMILLMVGGAVFFAAGVKIWKFVVVGVLGIVTLPLAWSRMHDYQKNRVITFLDPESDPMGTGYNLIQSKIAIGSGGFMGKGFMKGTQSQLSFLPEKQTDFIFTMFTEEFGFIGGVTIIALYCILIGYGILIATNAKSTFARLMAIGVTSIMFFHVFINIAMVMGLIPIVGVPLPLLSSGGTIMMTVMIGFGLLLNSSLYGDVNFDK
ncbi:MAG: rodA [Rickettsiaceae bacterium]|jgi:rod shape determining protein RodA|nr:rodA [Rickettsiaceae bacterium]